MERMTEKKIGKRKVKVHRMEGLYPCVRLEDFMEVCKGLEEENKKLKEEIRFLEECLDNKEKVNKSLREELSAYDREYFDEDKKAKNIFMEEDTLQELRDLGKL